MGIHCHRAAFMKTADKSNLERGAADYQWKRRRSLQSPKLFMCHTTAIWPFQTGCWNGVQFTCTHLSNTNRPHLPNLALASFRTGKGGPQMASSSLKISSNLGRSQNSIVSDLSPGDGGSRLTGFTNWASCFRFLANLWSLTSTHSSGTSPFFCALACLTASFFPFLNSFWQFLSQLSNSSSQPWRKWEKVWKASMSTLGWFCLGVHLFLSSAFCSITSSTWDKMATTCDDNSTKKGTCTKAHAVYTASAACVPSTHRLLPLPLLSVDNLLHNLHRLFYILLHCAHLFKCFLVVFPSSSCLGAMDPLPLAALDEHQEQRSDQQPEHANPIEAPGQKRDQLEAHRKTLKGLLSPAGVGACSRLKSGFCFFFRFCTQCSYTFSRIISRPPTEVCRCSNACSFVR